MSLVSAIGISIRATVQGKVDPDKVAELLRKRLWHRRCEGEKAVAGKDLRSEKEGNQPQGQVRWELRIP